MKTRAKLRGFQFFVNKFTFLRNDLLQFKFLFCCGKKLFQGNHTQETKHLD